MPGVFERERMRQVACSGREAPTPILDQAPAPKHSRRFSDHCYDSATRMTSGRSSRPSRRERDLTWDEITGTLPTEEVAPLATGPREHLALVALVGEHGRPWIAVTSATVIGRGDDCELRLDDAAISRRHARIFRDGATWFVEDLQSQNGTFVDAERLRAPRALVDGARLQIGRGTVFRVSLQDALEHDASRRMHESALTDPLTGLYNRRHLDRRLAEELAFARRHRTVLTLMLLDVDHFKRINDRYGHLAGDAVLRVLAKLIQTVVRTEDLVARYGGEEIAVIARGIDRVGAHLFAERLRKRIATTEMPWAGEVLRVTASIGVAVVDGAIEVPALTDFVGAADDALYAAKDAGRNRSVVAE
jgi:diguanylate cyclase (GGDEF)-like protein